ncbi:MAG: tyrosine-type recombinase/integrase [Desulfobacula sp.]|jgi:site-specific recombinase XerD|uniref:tyrosine-type recombinase/integrase n=1 Tax=Desulfobacula sp. TaxID=2593537 RepID=UPI001D895579|nr:tyrosine-type recombinase/integrase [Desulfobacula sp.]MBT3487779.1 tyrosine-type recombinase/integrase [Desulfobacula sp.]MBT3806650.1 tyrosine-type recombinase/integrase [Desulfobacula sp.]MBT4026548.1 tyrosine-type recombinase/integrase [Desulfobacula sp.]MBT4200804.1 tyrosine-type recombinase/integrase [Desulfobacula sp.]
MKKATNESVVIARHINAFLNKYVPSQKSHSSHTLKSYQYALALYIGFLETEKGIGAESLCGGCFRRIIIEEWLQWLMEVRCCRPETCNNRLASLRAFLKYMGSREIRLLYLSEDATRIPRKKEVRKRVKGMSKKAVQVLLSVPDLSRKTGRRDLSLMIIIYSTAARLDEILSLKIEQLYLDAEKPNVTVIGKGNKIRTLYLLPKAVAHLKKYLKEFHGDTPNPEAYVFYSRNTGLYGKMSQTAVNKQLKKHARAAHKICDEVSRDLHAHQLRHAKASHWLEDGMNIVQISFLLGHEQLQTTMVYVDITIEQELKALATLEDENDKKVSKKWKNTKGGLAEFCGVKSMKK